MEQIYDLIINDILIAENVSIQNAMVLILANTMHEQDITITMIKKKGVIN